MVLFFLFFSLIKMPETYGSDNLRVACLHDERGKILREKDYSSIYKITGRLFKQSLGFSWFETKIAILEKQIRKKLKDTKNLPLANIFLKKFKDKDSDFCPADYLDNEEKYLKKIKKWKNDFQKSIWKDIHIWV